MPFLSQAHDCFPTIKLLPCTSWEYLSFPAWGCCFYTISCTCAAFISHPPYSLRLPRSFYCILRIFCDKNSALRRTIRQCIFFIFRTSLPHPLSINLPSFHALCFIFLLSAAPAPSNCTFSSRSRRAFISRSDASAIRCTLLLDLHFLLLLHDSRNNGSTPCGASHHVFLPSAPMRDAASFSFLRFLFSHFAILHQTVVLGAFASHFRLLGLPSFACAYWSRHRCAYR